MKYEIKLVYCVYETLDEFSRRGGLVGIFTSLTDAEKHNKGVGWYGGNGAIVAKNVILIDDEVFLLESDRPVLLDVTSKEIKRREQERKNKILQKLTKEEQEILGLKIVN